MHTITWVFLGLLAWTSATSEKKVVCYFGSWSVHRPGNGKFDISDIDPTLCTHLIYAFVGITEKGGIRVLDSWQDLDKNGGKDGFGRFNKLREISPETKTMVSIGGWNEGSTKYSKVVSEHELRLTFIDNVIAFLHKHGFDGFDIDWEYPNQRGGKESDKENFVKLLKEMRKRFDWENLILSAAVGAAEVSASQSYDIAEVAKHVHFLNLMTYDFHGAWDKKTGINAPLYAGSWEIDEERKLNVNASIHYWLDQGAPPEKLVVGAPFYGKSFTLDDEHNNGIGAPANNSGTPGPYTGEAGTLGYNELTEKFMKENWRIIYQDEQVASYAVSGNQWVSFDDPSTLTAKAKLVNDLGLGGMMVWSVETDDFKGITGERYPLLRTINQAFGKILPAPITTTSPFWPPADTTTKKPEELPTPDLPAVTEICKEPGYVRDQLHCNTFYYCQPTGNTYTLTKFTCPEPLVFDMTIKGCNDKEHVKC